MPAITDRAIPVKPRRDKVVHALPSHAETLVEPAPLTMLCVACRTPRCARTDRTILWHPQYDRDGNPWDCAGSGLPGLETAA